MMQKQHGIALIQVLLLTAILMVFVLYLSTNAKRHVNLAQLAQDKALAQVHVHSAHSQVLFSLLTESKTASEQTKGSVAENWNFYGRPFSVDNTSTTIFDEAGKLSIHYIERDIFVSLLVSQGIDEERAVNIFSRLLDWQDADNIASLGGFERDFDERLLRNGKIADISELGYVFPFTDKERTILEENFTMFYVGELFPMAATEALLAVITSEGVASEVTQRRLDKNIEIREFVELTGLHIANGYRYDPSSRLSVSSESTVNGVSAKTVITYSLSPYAKENMSPYNLLNHRVW